MKNIIITTIALLTVAVINLNAASKNDWSAITAKATNDLAIAKDTTTIANTNPTTLNTNELTTADAPKESYELKISGGGFINPSTSESQFAVDVDFSTDPIKAYPNVWIGIEQTLSWQPSVAAETDVYSEYAWDIYKNLWLNTGWYLGLSYDSDTSIWNTGPEGSFEYYFWDHSLFEVAVSYDLLSRGSGNSQIPIKFGFGITF